MIILGINAYHGDASAVLLRDGQLISAVEEERFRRVKHWAGLPSQSIQACLEIAGIEPGQIDHFAISRNPRSNLLRKASFTMRKLPSPFLIRDRAKNALQVRDLPKRLARVLGLEDRRVQSRLHWIEHHPAHLASAFFVSPFDEAAVCAIDGFGDFVSTSWGRGRGNSLEVFSRTYFPHSLGIIYLGITQFLGFPSYGDEYKVMGLAPFGEPRFAEGLRRLIRLKPGGNFELDLGYFNHWSSGASMTWDESEPTLAPVYTSRMNDLLGLSRRPDAPLESQHADIAASLQQVYEEAAFHVLAGLYEKTRLPRLCLAGGCAMNSVANGKIRERTPFKEVFIQPAAADNGTALGAAYYVWNQALGKPREFVMEHVYWGPEFTEAELQKELAARRTELDAQKCTVREIKNEDELCKWTAKQIAEGKVVGWFQGRMEWGPRALGNRSILADPRRPDMREIINTKIKFREKFRPFASSILEKSLDDYFEGAAPDPFMIQVYPVRPEKRSFVPAVTHVDGSGRLQVVNARSNARYCKLLEVFHEQTGVPVLLNTSFNENEPIVLKPSEAFDCFLRTQMDLLVVGNLTVSKPC
jgi:carbamoyltransferase